MRSSARKISDQENSYKNQGMIGRNVVAGVIGVYDLSVYEFMQLPLKKKKKEREKIQDWFFSSTFYPVVSETSCTVSQDARLKWDILYSMQSFQWSLRTTFLFFHGSSRNIDNPVGRPVFRRP